MTQKIFKLPDLGEGIVEAEIVEWHVKPGDVVKEDQNIVDVMTDKATVEIPAPFDGTVVKINGEPGDILAVGSELIVFDTDAAGDAPAPAAKEEVPAKEPAMAEAAPAEAKPAPAKSPEPASPSTPPSGPVVNEQPLTSPSIRRRAAEAGVDLTQVPGTGPKGRISREDLDAFMKGAVRAPGAATPAANQKRTGTNEVKLIGLRRKIAQQMQISKRTIPHYAYVEEVDVTELEALRQHLNATRKDNQPKLTMLPFFMRALVKVIGEFPEVNATFDEEAGIITQYEAAHLGIATQTDNGLMVPVVKHAETLDIWDCASAVTRLAEAARTGKATMDELSGSSITITSLGPMGGIVTTPVINHPEVAIVGINKVAERVVPLNGAITTRKIMNLSSCFDHRVVDGYVAASMIQAMKGYLEHPATIFMP